MQMFCKLCLYFIYSYCSLLYIVNCGAAGPLEPADWWYYVKVLRGLRKRLYKDVKTMSMIEKKTFFRVGNAISVMISVLL